LGNIILDIFDVFFAFREYEYVPQVNKSHSGGILKMCEWLTHVETWAMFENTIQNQGELTKTLFGHVPA